jgi:hypothetical protein
MATGHGCFIGELMLWAKGFETVIRVEQKNNKASMSRGAGLR